MQCLSGYDMEIMGGTLTAKQITYTAVSQVPFEGFSSKSITSTLRALPINGVNMALTGQ